MFFPPIAPEIFLVGSVFATAVVVLLMFMPAAEKQTPAGRLAQYTNFQRATRHGSPGVAVETQGADDRLLRPFMDRLTRLASSTAPGQVRATAAAELAMAGVSMSPDRFLAFRGFAMFGLPLLAALYVLSAGQPSEIHWFTLGMAVLWGRRLPSFWLKRKIRRRQRSIDRSLPYALDLMVACLEGGLSLDASLVKVAEQSEGPLAEEIRKTLQEMALGRAPVEALRAMGVRTGAPDLKRLTENIVQAERMGISIADSLRSLAVESRVRRRQRAEEMARKAPIKMVPILIFFILPALAAVIMTPAVILTMRTLRSAGLE